MKKKRTPSPAATGEATLHHRSFLVPVERSAEWTALRDQWLRDYQPETATETQRVLRAAESEWQLRREEEYFDTVEQALVLEHGAPLDWTPEQHKRLQIFERRLDRAQRTLLRFERAAEQARRTRLSEKLRAEAHRWRGEAHQWAVQSKKIAIARAQAEAEEEEEASQPPPPPPHIPTPYQQTIGVSIRNGVTVTGWNPSHEGMQRLLDKMGEPHHLVERTMRIYEPLPPEYEWVRTLDGKPALYMNWITTVEQFRKDMARDIAEGNGHLTPSPFMPIYVQPGEREAAEKQENSPD